MYCEADEEMPRRYWLPVGLLSVGIGCWFASSHFSAAQTEVNIPKRESRPSANKPQAAGKIVGLESALKKEPPRDPFNFTHNRQQEPAPIPAPASTIPTPVFAPPPPPQHPTTVAPSLVLTGIMENDENKLALISDGQTTHIVAVGDVCAGQKVREIGGAYVILGDQRLNLAE